MPVIKKAFDNGMPIEEIMINVNKLLHGMPLIKALDNYYKELELTILYGDSKNENC